MSTETETPQGSGGEAVAAADEHRAPRNDAEAAQQERDKQAEPPKEQPKPDQDRSRNRTGEYIRRIQDDNRTLRQELEDLKRRIPPPAAPKPPDPNDFYQDPIAYTQAQSDYAVQQARQAWEKEQQQLAQQQAQQRVEQAYNGRVHAFVADKPDFFEVVGSIRFVPPPEVQAAIMAHESGPAIAYHLGLNEQDAFQLASTPPQYAAYVLDQIASRLKAAPADVQPPSPPAAPAETPKPISQAPAPAPRVGGRSPVEVPPEKMTDDEWYKQDVERRRKR